MQPEMSRPGYFECRVYDGVEIGPGLITETPVIVGKPARGRGVGEQKTRLGRDCQIGPFTTIYAGTEIGDRLQTGQGATIREDNRIGDDVSIGTNAILEFGNRIGDRVRIHSGSFLEMVTIGNDVFIGPNAVFCDDPHPMGCPKYKECLGGATIGDHARIGANSTILPGVKIGQNSLVGAGSVVVNDVPEDTVVVGNPARPIKMIGDLKCEPGHFKRPYEWQDQQSLFQTERR